MSSKGEKKKIKALNAPKAIKLKRKEMTWTVRNKAGAHKRKDSIALGLLLREQITVANNLREAKSILNLGEVKVNGVVRKEYNFAVGLFDIVEIEKQKLAYRVIFDNKRRIIISEVPAKTNEIVVKVANKHSTKKGIQIGTENGMIFFNDKAKIGDSLKIKVPENKIEEVLELKEGAIVYITRGTHCSTKGKVKEIMQGSVSRDKLVKVEIKGHEFETVARNILVIGEKHETIGDLKKI